MRVNLKATTALADWLRIDQGEKYVKDLKASGLEMLTALFARCAVSTDPEVRAAFARFEITNEHSHFLENVRLSKGVDEDE